LAIVVIGGLVSSTLLTLIVIPTLYEWVTAKKAQ
jgi:cobalt-zinc-cadmium resistance protein CzcA